MNIVGQGARGRFSRVVWSVSAGSLAALAGLSTADEALAQAANPAAPTRDQVDPEIPRTEAPPARLSVDGDIERAPCALADPSFANIRIKLSSADFGNLAPVSPADLGPAYQAYIGTDQPISVLCDVRDAAATILRNKGYLAAIEVPVQKIEDGAVRFEVLYAKVTTIRVMGDAGPDSRLLERYLSRVANGQPFNRLDAERDLLLAKDLPGYDVRLSLRPAGTGAGDMVGEVRVKHVPVLADLSIQNLASRETGRFGGQARVQFNGLLGQGDRTTLSVYSTSDFSEQQVYQLGHDMLVGSNGLRIGGRATYAITRPELGALNPEVTARSFFSTLEASYPVVRSQAASLSVAGGMELLEQRIRIPGTLLSEDKLRVAFLRFDGEAIDLKGNGPKGTVGWKARGSLQVRQGISLFNASPDCGTPRPVCVAAGAVPLSVVGADPTAFLIRGSAEIELRPSTRFTVSFAPRGQYSAKRLPAFEQFSTGNYTIGRGFDPGALVGDSGAGFQTELRLDSFRISPKSSIGIQPYGFTDHAWTWSDGGGGARRLSSAGGGVRVTMPGRFRFDLAAAFPTKKIFGETQRRDMRVLATLTTVLLPWKAR